MTRFTVCLFLLSICFSCGQRNDKTGVPNLVEQWTGKQILFPEGLSFFQSEGGLVDYAIPASKYKIVLYIDSIGCVSCELRLSDWKFFINELRAYTTDVIPVLFFLNPNNKGVMDQLYSYFEEEEFPFPFSVDSLNLMNESNHFPNQGALHTFLLNEDNKVILIGNPILNSKVRKLYEKVLFGKYRNEHSLKWTNVIVSEKMIDMGDFNWRCPQKAVSSPIQLKIAGDAK